MDLKRYREQARRLGRAYGCAFLAFASTGIPLCRVVGRIADEGNVLARRLSTWAAPDLVRPLVFLFFLPAFLAPMCFGAGSLERMDRRWGIQCPSCKRSLTLRTQPEQVAASGFCPGSRRSLFTHGFPDERQGGGG